MGRPGLVWGLSNSALRKHPLGCLLGFRWVGQAKGHLLGTGDRKQGFYGTGTQTVSWERPGAPAFGSVLRNASTVYFSGTSFIFPGLFLRRCGAIFGKYQHRGFLWPCSGPSFLSLYATVYFTGLCTLTQLSTSISWSRKSDGWKPKFCDRCCAGAEGLFSHLMSEL